MVSNLARAKRSLVALIRSLAARYQCCVDITRDSSDLYIGKAYRILSRKFVASQRASPTRPSKKTPVLGKMAYRRRARAVLKSSEAQQVAKNITKGFKKVCQKVVAKDGGHSGK